MGVGVAVDVAVGVSAGIGVAVLMVTVGVAEDWQAATRTLASVPIIKTFHIVIPTPKADSATPRIAHCQLTSLQPDRLKVRVFAVVVISDEQVPDRVLNSRAQVVVLDRTAEHILSYRQGFRADA